MKTFSVRRLARRLTIAFVALATPCIAAPVNAQIVSVTDPCYQILSEVGSLELLAKMVLSDATNLGGALYQMDAWKNGGLLSLSKRGDEIAEGNALTDAERQRWRRVRDCVDWLRDVAKRIDQAMADGAILELAPPTGTRQPRGTRVNRAKFTKDLVADIARMGTEIDALLKGR